jgi:hypothetical protein
VLIRGNNWLAFDGLFYSKIRHFQHTVPVMKDCKAMFFEGFLLPIFFWWVLDPVVSGELLLWSSKFCLVRVFAGVHFLCCLRSSAIFKASADIECPKEKDDQFGF